MLLGKYEVLGQLGTGGFGRVLLARNTEAEEGTESLVAIKRLRRARAQHRGIREAIEYEAEIGKYLRHPNIVHIIELAQVGADLLLVMEFINGLGLDELLDQASRRQHPIAPEIALEIAIQAGRGLSCAHSAIGADGRNLGIVHRDVKPSNIMIGREGRVRIMDFGVALASFRKFHTTTGTIKGTLRYLSPEQASGRRKVGAAADQYALSLVLGEMLLGQPVYEADREHRILLRAMKGEIGDAPERADRILPGIGPVLARGLALSPGERFESVGRLVETLLEVREAQGLREVPLEDLVHRGLEERARLALDEAASFGEESGALPGVTAPQRGPTSEYAPGTPLGWAHDQLDMMDEATVDGGNGDAAWQLVVSKSTPILPRGGKTATSESLWDVIASSESKVIMCADEDDFEDDDGNEDFEDSPPPIQEDALDAWDFSSLDADEQAFAGMRLEEGPLEGAESKSPDRPSTTARIHWSVEMPATSYAVKRARKEMVGSSPSESPSPRKPTQPIVAEPVDDPPPSPPRKRPSTDS